MKMGNISLFNNPPTKILFEKSKLGKNNKPEMTPNKIEK